MSCGSTIYIATETYETHGEKDWTGLHPLVRWIFSLKKMYLRRRQRKALLELDAQLLADIGLSREQAEQEARKPFWK
jgi:uncharacterized protein YjiS (DUF1127 family)